MQIHDDKANTVMLSKLVGKRVYVTHKMRRYFHRLVRKDVGLTRSLFYSMTFVKHDARAAPIVLSEPRHLHELISTMLENMSRSKFTIRARRAHIRYTRNFKPKRVGATRNSNTVGESYARSLSFRCYLRRIVAFVVKLRERVDPSMQFVARCWRMRKNPSLKTKVARHPLFYGLGQHDRKKLADAFLINVDVPKSSKTTGSARNEVSLSTTRKRRVRTRKVVEPASAGALSKEEKVTATIPGNACSYSVDTRSGLPNCCQYSPNRLTYLLSLYSDLVVAPNRPIPKDIVTEANHLGSYSGKYPVFCRKKELFQILTSRSSSGLQPTAERKFTRPPLSKPRALGLVSRKGQVHARWP